MNIRRVLLWSHRWVGLVAGLVIFVAAITGALIVIKRPLNRWLQPSLIPAQPATGTRAPVEKALAVLREKHPESRLQGIGLPRGDRDPIVLFTGNTVAHFDPSSGEMLGSHSRRTGFKQTLAKLHVNLLAGTVGGLTTQCIAFATCLALVLEIASGCVLRWKRPKAENGRTDFPGSSAET